MHALGKGRWAAAALLAALALGAPGCSSWGSGAKGSAGAPAAAPAPPAADPQKEVLAQDARRIQAMIQADAKVLGDILRDDLTYMHSSGQLESKTQVINEMVSGALRYQIIEPSEQTVRVYAGGDVAVMTGRVKFQVESQGRPVHVTARFTAVWVRESGVWRLAAWQSTRVS